MSASSQDAASSQPGAQGDDQQGQHGQPDLWQNMFDEEHESDDQESDPDTPHLPPSKRRRVLYHRYPNYPVMADNGFFRLLGLQRIFGEACLQ